MAVLSIGVLATVSAFTSGAVAITRAAHHSTASLLADAQMETYRALPSRDIRIDTAATVDATYRNDPACANPSNAKTCAANGVAGTETLPTGLAPDSCATLDVWFPATKPCTPSRVVDPTTNPAAPDGRSYRIDTYVVQLAAVTAGLPQRARKQVTVVVRDGRLPSLELARTTSIFDCSTGATPNSTDC